MERKTSEFINGVYGECRCCMAKGRHRDLSKEYYFEGKREVYADIFIDCFNLFLSSDARLTPLICKSCIKQLKDAHLFRTTVMSLETEMLQALSGQDGNETVFVNSCNGTEEDIKEETKFDVKDECNCSADVSYAGCAPDNDIICSEDTSMVNGEDALLSRFPRSAIVPLPTRSALRTLCPGYMKHLEKLKGKVIRARMLQEMLNETRIPRIRRKTVADKLLKRKSTTDSISTYATPLSEKMAHVANITTLLENSNLTAFMTKFKNGYPCFYCKKIFEKFDVLRDHQKEHSKDNIQKMILKRYKKGRPDSLVVYVDVTDLKCTVCDVNIPSVNDLKSHLSKQHKKILHSEYSDRVIPFRISHKYLCQVCNFDFETFGAIERHMNTHYRNYVCEICGAGFISKHRLKIHTYNIHSSLQGKYPCDACKKIFPTHRKYKIHYDFVHKMSKKLQCPKCPARFSYYYIRQKHLLDVHGETPVIYKCNVCAKEFKRRYPLTIHIKKEHLSQGDFSCEMCPYTCFSGNELKVHLIKKHGDKFVGKAKTCAEQDIV